jgi:hypothetical protein
MLHIQELQHKVQFLEAHLKTSTRASSSWPPRSETSEVKTETSEVKTVTSHVSFQFSDDDMEPDTPPDDLPNYDLTDKIFTTLVGKIDDEDNAMLKQYFTEAVRLGKHVQLHPRDMGPKYELEFAKESLAKITALLRLDADKNGFDQPCLRLLDTIEKEAKIGNNMRKKAKQRAVDRRKRLSYEDEVNDDDDDAKDDVDIAFAAGW